MTVRRIFLVITACLAALVSAGCGDRDGAPLPAETDEPYYVQGKQLMRQGRREEALAIYRWFRPLLDLDVSTYLVQNIKLAEVLAIGTNDRVRMPRQPLSGERRKAVEKIVRDALVARPKLPSLQTSPRSTDKLVAAE